MVEQHGIEKLLRALNPKKASGPDEIPARMLQALSDEIAPALTAFFQMSINAGEVPSQWKKAWITPVFKKGGRAEAANYRPISLTSIACKMLEHVMCTHIRRHLDHHKILGPENHGFRAKHSTESQLLLTTHDMLKFWDAGKQLDVAILDFSKTFDTVPHQRLLAKLDHYGVSGNVLNWVKSFLVERTQSVVVEGARSREEAVLSGVPQGTVLGPLLFILYINDLPSLVHQDTRCRLFADDCLVYRAIHSEEDQVILQQDLQNLERWAADWGMVFNPSKCSIMSVHKGRNQLTHFYVLCGVVLKSTEQERYLGVILSHNLSWGPHIRKLKTRANQKLGFIRRNLRGCPDDLRRLAYISMVWSGLEYASTVWDPNLMKDINRLEKVQRRAVRWISSNYNPRDSVTDILKTLELDTLEERRRSSRLVFLYKILNDHVEVPVSEMDIVQSRRPTRGNSTKQRLIVPHSRTSELKHSFTPKTVAQWNSLPDSTTLAGSVLCFRNCLTSASCP